MTNEKAIEILQNMAPGCGEKVRYPESMNYEAIDIAINALSPYKNEPLTLEQLRDKWDPCRFCSNADFGEYGFEFGKKYAKIACALGSWRFPKDEQFQFCPECGRPLTEEAWELLEKRLRR